MQKAILKFANQGFFTKLFLFLTLILSGGSAWCQTDTGGGSEVDYTLAYVLIMVMVLLLLIIWFLIKLLESSSDYFIEKWKKEQREASNGSVKVVALLFFIFSGISTFAQNADAVSSANDSGLIGGLPAFLFFLMISVVLVEFAVVMVLTWQVWRLVSAKKAFLGNEGAEAEVAEVPETEKLSLWDKFNQFKPLASEADLDLGHDFDGIRELDNKLPPWWLYGFYLTIAIGAVYFYRYNIAHTGLTGAQEYEASVEVANKAKEVYLKESASSVDENTVTITSDAAQIAAGMGTFKQLCAVCHGQKGEGLVGPNLTDEYWVYGGGIKDLFKTVKYGTNKGMQSWKENLSPEKIAQVVNYIHTLKGTNPPNPKAPDGTIYKDEAETSPQADTSGKKQ